MNTTKWPFASALAVALIIAVDGACAAIIADLQADYLPAVSLGQTSDDTGIAGSLAGSWHYYQDTDGNPATSGDRSLLTWQQDSDFENSQQGYAGTSFEYRFNVPIISADRLFDGPNPPPPAGTLMGHPAAAHYLAVEYRAHPFGQVDNVNIDYYFEKPNTFANARALIYRSGSATPLLNVIIGDGAPASGNLSGLGSLSAGESFWLMLGANGGFEGDQSWIKMTLNGDPVGVPEPGTCLLLLIVAPFALAFIRRCTVPRSSR